MEPDPQSAAERGNLLAGEPSAYLRQHAHNPVHWRPFSAAAFAAAAQRDVPVFLSIGYAACHWCHVMAHESFEDGSVAEYLNAHFVAVKVDREERPDVDAVYMAATQAISGQGGWPMSVFLAPDGRAFHAGTYFPPSPQPGRPSFRQVLEAVVEAWTQRRDQVEESAGALAGMLGSAAAAPVVTVAAGGFPVDAGVLAGAVVGLATAEDPHHGGFGGAPKFPPTPALAFLLRHAAGAWSGSSSGTARRLAAGTLSAMANSALYDQLGGGFARYSVTADWSLPHFEKMLYDNAGLLRAYAHWLRLPAAADLGHADFGHADARRVVAGTAEWLLAALRLEGGAFASSLDADTVVDGEHREGATYLWTAGELEAVAATAGLPGEGRWAARLMNVPAAGAAVLADDAGAGEGAPLHPGRSLDAAERRRWDALAPALRAHRAARPQPARDEKVVAGWNGMAIGALAEASTMLEDPALLAAAVAAADYLWRVHWDGTVLRRVSHDGAARGIAGLLEDYACCAEGFLALYSATADGRWYARAEILLDAADARFAAGGVLRSAPDEAGPLHNAAGGALEADPFDDATASAASVFAQALVSYAAYSGSTRHRAMAEGIVSGVPALARRAPRVAGGALSVAEALLAGPLEVAVLGPDTPTTRALVRAAALSPSPGLVLAVGWTDSGAADEAAAPPLLAGRGPAPDGGPLAYVCRGMVCRRPVGTVADLLAELKAGPAD
ncbi:thioredoxin domain-containing protein [Pseudarthrobacter sp. P1]|uniref:thioredoxin domain-containing protein n=1 Tax=Pseudarthrobacter sp. P1 TaxID=3418418 RepID=UPI003CF4CD6A